MVFPLDEASAGPLAVEMKSSGRQNRCRMQLLFPLQLHPREIYTLWLTFLLHSQVKVQLYSIPVATDMLFAASLLSPKCSSIPDQRHLEVCRSTHALVVLKNCWRLDTSEIQQAPGRSRTLRAGLRKGLEDKRAVGDTSLGSQRSSHPESEAVGTSLWSPRTSEGSDDRRSDIAPADSAPKFARSGGVRRPSKPRAASFRTAWGESLDFQDGKQTSCQP